MKRGGLGILIFLIVALLVAFLFTTQMQNPKMLSEKTAETAEKAAQDAVDAINHAIQNSALADTLQNTITQMGGNG